MTGLIFVINLIANIASPVTFNVANTVSDAQEQINAPKAHSAYSHSASNTVKIVFVEEVDSSFRLEVGDPVMLNGDVVGKIANVEHSVDKKEDSEKLAVDVAFNNSQSLPYGTVAILSSPSIFTNSAKSFVQLLPATQTYKKSTDGVLAGFTSHEGFWRADKVTL